MQIFSFFLYLIVLSPSPPLSLQPGSSTNCLQPPITRYTIIISGVLRSEESFNGSQTNATFTVPSCGASAVTVSAVNSAGTSVRSDPEIFSESVCMCVSVCVGMYRYMSHNNKILIMCYMSREYSTFACTCNCVVYAADHTLWFVHYNNILLL